jgi:hypothetical protein
MGNVINAYNISVSKPEQKRPLDRARYRWEDDIKMIIQETGCEKMGWTHVFKDIDQ